MDLVSITVLLLVAFLLGLWAEYKMKPLELVVLLRPVLRKILKQKTGLGTKTP